jgi:hypothetical protein
MGLKMSGKSGGYWVCGGIPGVKISTYPLPEIRDLANKT